MIKFEKPPNWDSLVDKFGVKWGKIVVTFSPHIYVNEMISDDLMAHEGVHLGQQGNDPQSWWDKYLVDPAFRFAQELEAYKSQFKHFKQHSKDRNFLFKVKMKLAGDLSGPIYGRCVNFEEALKRIG